MAGIEISQNGVSVDNAASWQFVFNSNWPSLAVAFDTLVTITPGESLAIPHNLGIYPLTMAWVIQNGVNVGRLFAVSENFENPVQTSVALTFDKNNVYLVNSDLVNSYTIDIKCYNLDISQPVNYTLPQFPPYKTAYDPTVGIKVTKYGFPITSTDLRDFILHSRCQSPAVLAIVTQPTPATPSSFFQGGQSIQYTNPTNYVPWVLAFVLSNGTYYPLAPGFQQTGYAHVLGTNSSIFTTSGNPTGSLVVLRDPLVASNFVEVIY